MRILVTGASGWIGSAVLPELRAAGHQVVGLARSDPAAATITALGAEVHRGDLADLDSLHVAAGAADAVIHLGYHHDFSRIQEAAELDLAAINAIGAALEGTDRPLVIASGVFGLAAGRAATEQDVPAPGTHPRLAGAEAALSFASRGVRSSVVRLAPTVHGAGDHGFVAVLVDIARKTGFSGYVADGRNQWPAIHRRDAARLFCRAMEAAPAGSVLHATADQGVPTRDIADAIGRGLHLPVESVPADQAGDHFGWLARFFGADVPASSEATRRLLDWAPTEPGLLADLAAGHYFAASPDQS